MPEPMKYEKILDALEELLTSRDMQAITVREIAQPLELEREVFIIIFPRRKRF